MLLAIITVRDVCWASPGPEPSSSKSPEDYGCETSLLIVDREGTVRGGFTSEVCEPQGSSSWEFYGNPKGVKDLHKHVLDGKKYTEKRIAKQLRNHRPLILNWFNARGSISLGAVEGLNNRLKLTFRKSYGIRTLKCTQIALYHATGDLPERPETHRFL